MIFPPDPSIAIVKEDGKMHELFRVFTESVSRLSIIIGTGSPEGVIEAEIGREYMDTTGIAGSIKYIKRDSDIAGDRTKGWILI